MNEEAASAEQITRCPHCDTSFRISGEQLAMAGGAVRCGSCLTIFQAEEHLVVSGTGESAEPEIASEEQDTPAGEPDVGSTEQDAGPVEQDAGPVEADAGPVEADAGLVEHDAGPVERDAGPVEHDAGLVERDAGPVEPEVEPGDSDVIYLGYDGVDDHHEKAATVEEPRPDEDPDVSNATMPERDQTLRDDYWGHFDTYVLNHIVAPGDVPGSDESRPAALASANEAREQQDSHGAADETADYQTDASASQLRDGLEADANDAESVPADELVERAVVSTSAITQQTDVENTETEPAAVIDLNLVDDADAESLIGEYQPPNKLNTRWAFAAVVMVFISVFQVAWFNLDQIASDERYRPYCIDVCRYLGCNIVDYSNPNALKTSNLLIRTHPEAAGALIVDAIVRNSAAFKQKFPGIRLQFQDRDGTTIASRTFHAADYLAGELRGLIYIPANTEVRFALEIADPGDKAVGYEMTVEIN
jgi:predicted Zn finger-like uncharacterized protein